MKLHRRDFLLAAGASLIGLPRPVWANNPNFWSQPRQLWLYRKDSRENGNYRFWTGNAIDGDAYSWLCYMLRDSHDKTMAAMDVNLLNLLYGLQQWLHNAGIRQPLVVHSGLRTPQHNANVEGAARNSMHMYGKAADIAVPGVEPQMLFNMAAYFGMGGVGLYPTFIHVDTGRKRYWSAKVGGIKDARVVQTAKAK